MNKFEKWYKAVKNLTYYSASVYPTIPDAHGNLALEHDYAEDRGRKPVDKLSEAHLISSLVKGSVSDYETHKIAIDIDWPAVLIPSSTEGHYHLIIDKKISWSSYVRILEALGDCGVVQSGYARASIARGRTDIRTPWIRKPENQITSAGEIPSQEHHDNAAAYLGTAIEKSFVEREVPEEDTTLGSSYLEQWN